MTKPFIKYIWLLPIYVLLQVLVLNEVLFYSYINPYLYLALIISWPIKTPKWRLLFYSFVLGLLVDILSGNLGFHSTATVFIAFIKPVIAKITIPHNILAENDEITINKIGNKAFIIFSFLIIFIHNTTLFILEHLDFNLNILIKILASSIVTLIVILILEIFKSSKK